ncbi:MAG: AraC family transcriptional regulator [Eubacteriales bacterium]|nr:AraC family transcriptional regulator [Eubacteriales bacterium]
MESTKSGRETIFKVSFENRLFQQDKLIFGDDRDNRYCDECILIKRQSLGRSTRLHYHDCYELEIVLQGSGTHVVNSVSYPVNEGDVSLISPADIHKYIIDDMKMVFFNVKFKETALSDNLKLKLYSMPLPVNFFPLSTGKENIQKEFMAMEADAAAIADAGLKKAMLKARLECVLIYIFNEIGGGKYLPRAAERTENESGGMKIYRKHRDPSDESNRIMLDAISYIRNNFRRNIKIREIAAYCNYSVNYFGVKFKEYTSMTYADFLNELRLEFAYQLIVNTACLFKEACNEAGFESFPYFSRLFKTKYGCSPKYYREARAEKLNNNSGNQKKYPGSVEQ